MAAGREFETAQQAWEWILAQISVGGTMFRCQDETMTREIENVAVSIRDPGVGWPLKNSEWSMPGLEAYAAQLMTVDPGGFDYTYGNRMTAWFLTDQIYDSVKLLQAEPDTRRATIVIWDAECEHDRIDKCHEVPCMIAIQPYIRSGKLNMTAVFRSQDMRRAWPQNVFGLAHLQRFMATGEHLAVVDRYVTGTFGEDFHGLGVKVGTLSTMTVSAHVYY